MEYLELELEVLLTATPSTRICWKPGVQWSDGISNRDKRGGLCPQRACTLTPQSQAGVSPRLTLQLPGTLVKYPQHQSAYYYYSLDPCLFCGSSWQASEGLRSYLSGVFCLTPQFRLAGRERGLSWRRGIGTSIRGY